VLEINPIGAKLMGFECEEEALARHVEALVTHFATGALGAAQADKLPAEVREQMGDVLRSLLRPPRKGRLWDDQVDGAPPYVVQCRPNCFTFHELQALARAARPPAGAAAQGSAGGGHTWTPASMLRLIEIWTMQKGDSLEQWRDGAKGPDGHGITEARLEQVAKSWELILGGSTELGILDAKSLKQPPARPR
jgi:hypothetical protein